MEVRCHSSARAMLISSPPQVALLETSPYLLALTIIVSIVHSVFEFLAFKNGRHGVLGHQGICKGSISSLFLLVPGISHQHSRGLMG